MSQPIRSLPARVVGLAVALGVLIPLASPPGASAAESYAEYHDLTSAQHSAQTASLEAAGYRPISLNISGDPADPRYAGAWVQRSGPSFTIFQDKTLDEYQSILGNLPPGGQPTIVTATGAAGTARFAGVLEDNSLPFADIDAGTYGEVDGFANTVRGPGIMHSLSVYGSAAAPLVAALWRPDIQNVGHFWSFSVSASLQKKLLDVYTQAGSRPSLLTIAPDGTYSTIWHNDVLGGGWKSYTDLKLAQYESKLASLSKSGWHVIDVAAHGTGADARYAAIFAKTDVPQEREWHVTGTAAPSLAAFDAWAENFMQVHRIRAGELAVVRDGRLMYARGFTWAEPGYELTQPTDLFRIGSTTKPLTSIVINRLTEATGPGALHMTDTMQSILDLHPPGGGAVADGRWNDITVSQLLTGAGGWTTENLDPLFFDDVIADSFGTRLPVSKLQIATFMAGQPLQFTPGTQIVYSNFGFFLLGRIIEKLRPGRTYTQSVKDLIFQPLGLKRPTLGKESGNLKREVTYEPTDPLIATTVMKSSGKLVPSGYGDFNLGNADSAGSFVMSAPDYAKILAAFDQPTNPLLTQASVDQMWTAPLASEPAILRGWIQAWVPDEHGNTVNAYHHNGSLPGLATLVFRRADGISFVLFFNRELVPPNHVLYGEQQGRELSDIANEVTDWPSDDLFPTYGIPAF